MSKKGFWTQERPALNKLFLIIFGGFCVFCALLAFVFIPYDRWSTHRKGTPAVAVVQSVSGSNCRANGRAAVTITKPERLAGKGFTDYVCANYEVGQQVGVKYDEKGNYGVIENKTQWIGLAASGVLVLLGLIAVGVATLVARFKRNSLPVRSR